MSETLEDKYQYMCELVEDQSREIFEYKKKIAGAQKEEEEFDGQNTFLKLVKDITSKGFVRSNYKKNLVDLSDIKINLKGKK